LQKKPKKGEKRTYTTPDIVSEEVRLLQEQQAKNNKKEETPLIKAINELNKHCMK